MGGIDFIAIALKNPPDFRQFRGSLGKVSRKFAQFRLNLPLTLTLKALRARSFALFSSAAADFFVF